jgi:hypothetical protein
MKKTDKRLYATLDALIKLLTVVFEEMKADIRATETYTFNNYCNLNVVSKTKMDFSKEVKQQMELWALSQGYEKEPVSSWKEIKITKVNPKTDKIINDLLMTLSENTTDKTIAKLVANALNSME